MKFFGITNLEEIESIENNKSFDNTSLIREGAFIDSFVRNSGKVISTKEPSKALKYDLYNFLTKQYASYITGEIYSFFAPFEDKIFGRNKEEQRNLALDEFNRIYEELGLTGFTLPRMKKSDNEIKSLE